MFVVMKWYNVPQNSQNSSIFIIWNQNKVIVRFKLTFLISRWSVQLSRSPSSAVTDTSTYALSAVWDKRPFNSTPDMRIEPAIPDLQIRCCVSWPNWDIMIYKCIHEKRNDSIRYDVSGRLIAHSKFDWINIY